MLFIAAVNAVEKKGKNSKIRTETPLTTSNTFLHNFDIMKGNTIPLCFNK